MKPRLLALGILLLVLIILVFQNSDVVTLHFLFWKISASQIIFFSAIAFVGGIAGFLVGMKRKR